MITEGIITNVSSDLKTCSVRIPFFETTATSNFCIFTEVPMLTIPGLSCDYRINDKVWIGFENNKIAPILLGKMFLESETERGAISCENISVKNNAILPLSTLFQGTDDSTIIDQKTNLNSILKIINAIKELQNKTTQYKLTLKLVDSNENIFITHLITSKIYTNTNILLNSLYNIFSKSFLSEDLNYNNSDIIKKYLYPTTATNTNTNIIISGLYVKQINNIFKLFLVTSSGTEIEIEEKNITILGIVPINSI